MSGEITEVKVELDSAGIGVFLNSPEVQAFLLQRAQGMAKQATAIAGKGAKFKATVRPGKHRARASIITDNDIAKRAEAQDRALTRSIDGARG